MNLLSDTVKIQHELAMYCRTGVNIDLPGTAPGRLLHYRRLVFNVIQDNLEAAFPVTFEYLSAGIWQAMVSDFFTQHTCRSNQVWQLPGEFCAYVISEDLENKFQVPYLNDLLRFEWAEMEIYNMPDMTYPVFQEHGVLWGDVLVFNPEFKILQLRYPVHKIKPTEIDVAKNDLSYVLLYREKEAGRVQFIELSFWYALLIEQVHQHHCSIADIAAEVLPLMGNVDHDQLKLNTIAFIKEMKEKEFVLGFK
jgi:hypothetical protein